MFMAGKRGQGGGVAHILQVGANRRPQIALIEIPLARDRQLINRQDRPAADNRPASIADQHGIDALIGGANGRQHQGGVGCPSDIDPIESPLVSEETGAGGCHGEGRR